MSVFQFISNAPLPIRKKVTGNTVTTIVPATNNTIFIPWMQVNEIGNTVQNLTVDIYDGTNTFYQGDDSGLTWKAKAVVALNSYRFTQGIVLAKGELLRVTSSDAAGKFDVTGIYVNVTG